MKKITIITLISILAVSKVFAQNEKTRHFEINAMVGMHHYASSYFHAINSVTWFQNPDGNIPQFSGYGTSILPAFNASYFFNNNIGITAGITPINAENVLELGDTIGTRYSNTMKQNNINIGIVGRVYFEESPISINMSTGIVISPFEITNTFDSNTSGSYLTGNTTGIGFYGSGSFQIRIIKFLNFKTQFSYSFIPTEVNLFNPNNADIEQNINNLNIGGLTVKSGLSVNF